MSPNAIRGLTLLCLATCAGALLWPPQSTLGTVSALPLLAAALAGLKPGRRWGGWVAALMIPYLTVGAMNILAGPMPRLPALALGIPAALAFIAGLGWTRSIGASLKG